MSGGHQICDASAKGKSFSEATVDISANEGFPLFCCQLAGIGKLLSYLEGNLEKSAEIERLEKFFADKQHTECLLSLDKSNEYNEYNIQVILAAHLFGPLAGSFEIGSKGFSKDAKRCPKCGIDISENLKNTSL
ncbi:uncharacterized protein LOC132738822, partial [Ruditapes philippinarum]|uniref:uncharacterized protein LOC132738822 n=1 Tax=Ruditapes philippinarum TaxID=129788 RepID=UPI00295B1719